MINGSSKQTALITGGAQGIGKAIAERFLRDGMNVLIADWDQAACSEAVMQLKPLGNTVDAVCDVSDEADVQKAVALAIEHFGRIDVLVCNAGISSFGVPVADFTLAQWLHVININLTGCFLCAKYCVPYLEKTRGSIITIASTRAIQSEPHTEAYSASKGGLVALTHALAVSLGPKVRANSISPGWIEISDWKKWEMRTTPHLTEKDHAQHPVGRVGTPEDIAAVASFLASKDAGFITGQNFVADGGMTRKMIYTE